MTKLHVGGCDSCAALIDVFSHPATWLKMMLLKVTCCPCVTFQALSWVTEGTEGDLGSVADIKFIYWTKYDTELSAHTYAHAYTIRQCRALTHPHVQSTPSTEGKMAMGKGRESVRVLTVTAES